MSTKRRKRVLFFAEPATLAHVARPTVLAQTLSPQSFDVLFATGPDYEWIPQQAGLQVVRLGAIGNQNFMKASRAGRPVFPFPVLKRYVEEDLRLIRAHQPDVVIGDFRLSLGVSARMASVPYIAITNAYWSPLTPVKSEAPVHFLSRCFTPYVANTFFPCLRPAVYAQHSLPMYRLRKKYGLPSVGFDLRAVFAEADKTLFADVPMMVPTRPGGAIGRYEYIGPVVWSPDEALPPALERLNKTLPIVYVALGSSGDSRMLNTILAGLSGVHCRTVVAVGSDLADVDIPEGVIAARYLPGSKVAQMADVVICNGGSPTTHQALEQGVPVLGIAENMDQIYNMQFVTRCGAGLALRSDCLSVRKVRHRVDRLLKEPRFRLSAQSIASEFRAYPASKLFPEIIARMN